MMTSWDYFYEVKVDECKEYTICINRTLRLLTYNDTQYLKVFNQLDTKIKLIAKNTYFKRTVNYYVIHQR